MAARLKHGTGERTNPEGFKYATLDRGYDQSHDAPMLLGVNNFRVEVSSGTSRDVELLLTLIRSMAAFEKLTVPATAQALRDASCGDRPAAYPALAFGESTPIGDAVYFSWFTRLKASRALWLDDLLVSKMARRGASDLTVISGRALAPGPAIS